MITRPSARPAVAPPDVFDPVPNGNLPPMPYRDMPEPLPLGKVLGPSVILAGLGVGSGEYILWPFMASTVGLGFLWAAVLGVTVQYFLNMEIERYTLATGETAVAGFVRFWKPWGVLFCLFTIVPNMWPGWATSGVTILTFLIGGGNVPLITIGVLIASGVALTVSPVVYQTLERAQFFKVGLTLVFLAIALVAAIGASAWADLPQMIIQIGRLPDTNVIPVSLVLSGLVFAGAGGVNNLAQSNWIRDKGFGMGVYIPRIVSPITGEEVAAPATGSMVRQDAENLRR
ncbi:MAG: Nramp family divalent metal transporter, partial [Vicinamibacterales bacterium]